MFLTRAVKQAPNEANNAINSAKRQCFMHNLVMNKKSAVAIWPVTGQGVKNARSPAVR